MLGGEHEPEKAGEESNSAEWAEMRGAKYDHVDCLAWWVKDTA